MLPLYFSNNSDDDAGKMLEKGKRKKHKHHKHSHHKSKKHHTAEKVIKKGHKKHKHKHKSKHAKAEKADKLEVKTEEIITVKPATNGNGVVVPVNLEPVVISEDEESDVVPSLPPSDSEDVDVGIIEDDMNLEELMKQKELLQARLGAYESENDESERLVSEKLKKEKEKEPPIINLIDDEDETFEIKPVPKKERELRAVHDRPR